MAYNSKYTGAEVENLLGKIDNKQDAISDLDAIRSGANKGATAVQPENIPNEVELIAISGDMLADEPTYTVTEAQAIIDAYNANKLIAIKCGTRINFGKGWFIPNINIRTQSGMSQIFLSGILGNYYIEHRIIYNTSAGTISTAAQSFIDLSEGGGSSEGGSSAYAEVNHGTSDTTFELTPNTFHVWDEVASLNLTLGDETYGVANEYLFQFVSPATPTTLTLPDDIKFSDDLVIEANKIYQISILKGLGSVLSWENGVALIENKATITSTGNKATVTLQYAAASSLSIKVIHDDGSNTITIPVGEVSGSVNIMSPMISNLRISTITPEFDTNYIYVK